MLITQRMVTTCYNLLFSRLISRWPWKIPSFSQPSQDDSTQAYQVPQHAVVPWSWKLQERQSVGAQWERDTRTGTSQGDTVLVLGSGRVVLCCVYMCVSVSQIKDIRMIKDDKGLLRPKSPHSGISLTLLEFVPRWTDGFEDV